MIKLIRKFFSVTLIEEPNMRQDEFIWALAEALLWRDEEVSAGAIPSPIKQQAQGYKYYDDAKYLIQFVTDRWSKK